MNTLIALFTRQKFPRNVKTWIRSVADRFTLRITDFQPQDSFAWQIKIPHEL